MCKYSQRLKVPGFEEKITCGSPVFGTTIELPDKSVKLCGCVMEQKCKDPEAECPINKW